MSRQLTTSRASRNRRLIAISIWLCLIVTAMVMWNSRTQRMEIFNPSEPVAFLLAAFTAFVGLFSWMLFNPARGVSAETTTLMLAGAATLFPPCIIAFCTMPPDSMLGGWLTAGLFMLLVIGVMSPVPDEFFGIPRDRHSYFQQVSIVGLGDQSVLDLHPDWLQSTDLTTSVAEVDRPSLAPSSWRDQEQLLPRTERRRRIESESDPKNRTAEARPIEKRKGIFGRLRDRASSLRDGPSSLEVTPTDERFPEQQQSSRNRSTDLERGSQRQPKPETADRQTSPPPIPVIPIPFESPVPHNNRDVRPPHADSSVGSSVAEVRPSPHRDDSLGSRGDGTSESAKGLNDPFALESSPRTPPRNHPFADSTVGRSQPVDGLQVADQSRQTGFDRVTDERGGEMIEGTVTIRFDRGQKRANIHVPFSPPLSGTPEVECDTADDQSIRVKVPERRAWGLRIEGRRSDASMPQESEIAFSAVYVPNR